MTRYYVTTAIPYVNGAPHIGHALELVQADTLARHHRQLGHAVRAQTGTDDNSLKNVASAQAAGVSTSDFVGQVAARFQGLTGPLELSFDDFLRTSSDPRHRPGVERLWEASAQQGDLYRKNYSGLYCLGCEQFYTPDELVGSELCPEHGVPVERIEETNWFFRLSRYSEALHSLISGGRLRVEPDFRRREVLAFIESGLQDFSVSRSRKRAGDWGIPVPGDPEQVIYVWFDALANYITGPGYGSDPVGFDHWWTGAEERVHVIGKGILRFHAVYWPAMLLSAGLDVPTIIGVHEYLTVDGSKISKSAGNTETPEALAQAFGTDAVRWWLLSDVARSGDTDFTRQRLVTRYNEDLANTIGNLVNRTAAMVAKYRGGQVPLAAAPGGLQEARQAAPGRFRDALDAFDFRAAARVVVELAEAGNRFVETHQPWRLAKNEQATSDTEALDTVLSELVATGRALAELLAPLLPSAATRLDAQLGGRGSLLPTANPVFRRMVPPEPATP